MHDFCFTLPYGVLLALGGVVGFLRKGSVASLAGGVGSGLLLYLAGQLQLKAFEKRKNSLLALLLQLGTAATLSVVLGMRYMDTGKIMPAGLVAGLSVVMTVFYVVKIAAGGNRFKPKSA